MKASKVLFLVSLLFTARRCAIQLFWRSIIKPFYFYSIASLMLSKWKSIWDLRGAKHKNNGTLWRGRNLWAASGKMRSPMNFPKNWGADHILSFSLSPRISFLPWGFWRQGCSHFLSSSSTHSTGKGGSGGHGRQCPWFPCEFHVSFFTFAFCKKCVWGTSQSVRLSVFLPKSHVSVFNLDSLK